MSNIIPFNPTQTNLALPDYLASYDISQSTFLQGATETPPLISTAGGMFAAILDGQMQGRKQNTLDVVIVAESPVARQTGRIFYAGKFDPNGEAKSPDCFSNDGVAPDAAAPNKQCGSCAECPKNIKGSGDLPGTAACRYTKTLAVVVPAAGWDVVWNLRVSAQGIFAKADVANNIYGLQSLRVMLAQRKLPAEFVLMRLSFPEGSTGGLRFSPIGMLDAPDAQKSWAHARDPQTMTALKIQGATAGGGNNAAPALGFAQPEQAPQQPVYAAPVQQAPQQPVYAAPVQQAPQPVYAAPVQQAPQPVYVAPPAPPVQQPVYAAPQQVFQQAPQPEMQVAPPQAVAAPAAPVVAPRAAAMNALNSRLANAFN